ncbi:hypothetical protein [Lacinutrix sp. Bg11-31]|uniref:hypothetical protein n=1 Tax=Lacinutrix sp. Bg11-31 TaxID=2057808 RepID=UPI000C2FFFEE|nr:hypothetical protein [Lacinutrix sp. Bg11-31]AUC82510.1 hypothetical protein CW733_10385 [Lacinutrix sp. Bg11-31]
MKSKNIIQIVLVSVFMLTISSFKSETKTASINQEEKTISTIFDGAEDYGYNFIFTNDDEDESTITFQNVNDDVLEAFDLKSEALVGTSMKVTYTVVIETEEDEDGFESETEILTITKLEQI